MVTVAAGFPTAINPIIQLGAVLVFVDVCLLGFDIDLEQPEATFFLTVWQS